MDVSRIKCRWSESKWFCWGIKVEFDGVQVLYINIFLSFAKTQDLWHVQTYSVLTRARHALRLRKRCRQIQEWCIAFVAIFSPQTVTHLWITSNAIRKDVRNAVSHQTAHAPCTTYPSALQYSESCAQFRIMKSGIAHIIFKSVFLSFSPIVFTSLARIRIQGVRRFLQLLTLVIYNIGLHTHTHTHTHIYIYTHTHIVFSLCSFQPFETCQLN
jgi:hypothetical protein